MGSSAIAAHRELLLETIRETARGEWKVLVLDEDSKRLLDVVAKEDDILRENVTNIELIESRRSSKPTTDAVYILSPKPYVVDCLMDDFEGRRYRRAFLVWTSLLPIDLRQRIDSSPTAREQIAAFRILNVEFFPRESHLITFRDPWSFPMLFHPGCDTLVRSHMDALTQKIVSICVTLGEYPTIRYYKPRNANYAASVLCSHLANLVQEGLDQYASHHEDFPPPSPRPRGVLLIVDRSMDLFAPLIHEFTYQAMVHELLPVIEGDKTIYRNTTNPGTDKEEVKEMELTENDKIWLQYRHMHMKDMLEQLVADFNKFRSQNPQFGEDTSQPSTLSNIKEMIAGLPQFQEGKELYALHLNMAQECMDIFNRCKLPDVAVAEQSMATGLDEDFKKPKELTDQLVRLLDEDAIPLPDRLRLIIQYAIFRDGIFPPDAEKLLLHARLPAQDKTILTNMDLLGSRLERQMREHRTPIPPPFPYKPPLTRPEELSLSRFEPAVKPMLEDLFKGTLDKDLFPYTKPVIEGPEPPQQNNVSQSSLRSAKPTWARTRPSAMEPRQRVIVFMAGGATWSESRSCYEVSQKQSKDVYMASTHMLTPGLFLRQVGDLSVDRQQLALPADRPPQRPPPHVMSAAASYPHAPAHAGAPGHMQPPTAGLAAMTMSSNGASGMAQPPRTHPLPSPPYDSYPPGSAPPAAGGKPSKEAKKRGFFRF